MDKKQTLSRQEALAKLKRYGIRGPQVYLIDLIPLVEMIWADDCVQESETKLLYNYLEGHVRHINKLAGAQILSLKDARAFVDKFIKERPDAELMRILRGLIEPVRSTANDAYYTAIKKSLLAQCLNIGFSAFTDDSSKSEGRFDSDEKKCFVEIMESL